MHVCTYYFWPSLLECFKNTHHGDIFLYLVLKDNAICSHEKSVMYVILIISAMGLELINEWSLRRLQSLQFAIGFCYAMPQIWGRN